MHAQKADSEWRTINPNLATLDIHCQCLWPSALLPSYHGRWKHYPIESRLSVEDFSDNWQYVALLFLSGFHRKIGLKIKMYVLMQMAVPLYVIPWCISRGKQCFWRPVWRPLCTLLLLYMSTTVLLRWSLTLSPCQATSLSLSMGKSVLLSKNNNKLNKILFHF